MNTMRYGVVGIMAMSCGIVLFACGSGEKVTERAVERRASDRPQTVLETRTEGDDTSIMITGEDGQITMVSGSSAGIPEGFPKDVPIHSSLKINMSLTDGAAGFTIQGTTDDKFESIVYYYTEESRKRGWTEQMNMLQNLGQPMQMLVYQKDERMMNLVIQQEGDIVNLSLSVAEE